MTSPPSSDVLPATAPTSVPLAVRFGYLVAGLGLSVGIYTSVNLWMAQEIPDRVFPTLIDDWVPFYAPTVIIYLGIYALAIAPVCILNDVRVLQRGAGAYATLLLSAVPIWVLWPVTVPRETVPVHDLFTWGVALMRFIDPPVNCLPSMHVGETILATLLCWRLDRRAGVGIGILTALVWWSTLALDQHWFVDGLSGAILAWVSYKLWFDVRPLPAVAWRALPLTHFVWALGLYIIQFLAAALPWWLGLATAEDVGGVSALVP